MASKRCLQEPVLFTKLPRLEPAARFLPGKTPGSSGSLPHPGSENHFSYKGSYFACPLQSPEGPEQPLARWSPSPARPRHGAGAMSQPVPAQGPLPGFLLCQPEGLGTRLQPPDALKSKDSLSQEQLMARKKLDSLRCPLPLKKPVLVSKAAPLAVPRPVYGALPASFLAPRMALLLGARGDSLQQRPGEANWALPPAPHPLHPGEPHKRGPCSEVPGLLPLPPSLALPSKEQLVSPVALPPRYYASFDQYGPPPSSPFLEASCPPAQSQKKVPEVPRLSPEPWPQLQAAEPSPVTRERSAMCFPPPPYPLSPHRAGPLCHPPAATAGEPGALPTFGYVGSRELFSSTYLKAQAPGSYFGSPLDPYVPRPAVLRDAEPPRDAELPRYPGFALSPGDAAVFHASFPGTEPGCEQLREDSPQWRAPPRHSSAFQPVCASEKLPEAFPKREGSWEKPRQGEEEEEALYPGRRNSSPAPQDTPRACKVRDPAEELLPRPSPSVSPTKGLESQRDTKAAPSSPPMPVIHNVFSLAPYREYLERAKDSEPVLFCRKQLWEDSPPQNTAGSQEPAALRDVSGVPSLGSGSDAVQSQGESCYGSVPKKPKPVPQELEPQEGSPNGVGTEELPSENMVLDLSLKKGLVEAGETQGPTGCAEGTLDREDKEEEEKEAAGGGKVGLGEGGQPRLPEVDSGDRSSFQSSATFMFQKYKLLPPVLPSAEPPRQEGSPQPSPASSTPALPASSPASSLLVPLPGAQLTTIIVPNPPQILLPAAPCALGQEKVSEARRIPSRQYFTTLHTSLCDKISGSVSSSSPELLRQWLEKAEPAEEPGETPKNGSEAPQKPSNGKEIWLAFQDVEALFAKLLSQLETFRVSCPFPHVVRAGAVFIPIHVVKEKLFPKLPGSFVDQVLQKHKVELRPTTLSEEKHLRDLELKSCTSRMLKLLALKQLPEIYPDLLNLHWHNSIRQQLGSSSQTGQHPPK